MSFSYSVEVITVQTGFLGTYPALSIFCVYLKTVNVHVFFIIFMLYSDEKA